MKNLRRVNPENVVSQMKYIEEVPVTLLVCGGCVADLILSCYGFVVS